MSFAFSNIILNQLPLTQSAGRLYINGNAIAFSSETAGGVTGLTVESGDARYVRTSGNQTITGGLKVLSGILGHTGQVQIDPFNSYLYSEGAISVDWAETRSLSAYDQSYSLLWDSRELLDSSETTVVNWQSKQLSGNWQTNTSPTATGHIVNKGYLDSVTGSLGVTIPSDVVRTTGNQTIGGQKTFQSAAHFSASLSSKDSMGVFDSLDCSSRQLFKSDGTPSILWDSGILVGLYGENSIEAYDGNLKTVFADSSGSVLNWQVGELYDYSLNQSVEWVSRKLDGVGGYSDVRIDWLNNIISGNWQTNTIPTLSGHILNKGYFDSVSGSLGGGSVPSDVVRTSGNQSIAGRKTFSDVVITGASPNFLAGKSGQQWISCDADGFFKIFNDAYSSSESVFSSEDMSFSDGLNTSIGPCERILYGVWQHTGIASSPSHVTNKQYVDSTSSYTIPFGHAAFNPLDSTTYYFGAAFGIVASSSQSTSPASAVPKSGVLKSVIGTATVAGTLGSSETVSLVVYKNGTSVATGTYLASARNNVVSSGVNNLNIPVSELDTLQLSTVCPAWATNPTSVTQSFNAYITLA